MERASFLPDWQACSRYLFPRSGRFTSSDRNRGGSRMNNLYDTSGTRALRVLEAGLMAGMTSPARPWFRLTTHDSSLAEFGPVKEWLDDTTVLMRDIFAQSNTYRALHTVYGEVAAFATGATLIDSNFESVIHHTPFTAGEFGLACDERDPAVWLACLRGDGCAASRAELAPPAAQALAQRLAVALRARDLQRFLPR